MIIAGTDPHPVDATETHRLVDAAIALLHRYAEGNQPFFLRMDFPGPHHPFMPPEPWATRYPPESIPPFPNFIETLADKPYAHRRLLTQRGVAGWGWERWRQVNAKLFGFMSYIDWEIGRLLEAVDRLGLREQLFVAHFADHGGMSGHHGGQFNKGPVMYDDVYHIPLIVRYPPLVRAGAVCPALVRHMDLMPTVLELAQVPVPDGLHARSLVPVLKGETDRFLDAVFAEYHGEEWGLYSQRMLRTPTHKLVYNPHDRDELYDLVRDPHEMVNRAEDPAYAAVRERLERQLLDWMQATDDPLYLWTRRLYPPPTQEAARP
jgi:arylsulfatase A-like enzyme